MAEIVSTVRKLNGMAGQYGYDVVVKYPDEPPRPVTFLTSTYGGPIVMMTNGTSATVDSPSRFGDFSPEWVRRFFAD